MRAGMLGARRARRRQPTGHAKNRVLPCRGPSACARRKNPADHEAGERGRVDAGDGAVLMVPCWSTSTSTGAMMSTLARLSGKATVSSCVVLRIVHVRVERASSLIDVDALRIARTKARRLGKWCCWWWWRLRCEVRTL